MLSDRLRWLKLSCAVLLLVMLGARYTWYASHLPFGWRACITEPARHDGRALIFPLYTVAEIQGPDRYRIRKVVEVPVEGDTAGLAVGMSVSVQATFRAADAIAVEVSRTLHPWRKYKKLLGIVGLILAVLAAPLAFDWRAGRLITRG